MKNNFDKKPEYRNIIKNIILAITVIALMTFRFIISVSSNISSSFQTGLDVIAIVCIIILIVLLVYDFIKRMKLSRNDRGKVQPLVYRTIVIALLCLTMVLLHYLKI